MNCCILLLALCIPGIEDPKQVPNSVESAKLKEFADYCIYYYLTPKPDKAGMMLKQYILSPFFTDTSPASVHHIETTAYFFSKIAQGKPSVIDAYVEIFRDGSHEQRGFMLKILQGCGNEQTVLFFQAALKEGRYPDEKAQIESALKKGIPNGWNPLTSPITEGGDLDFLWWDFMATGRDEPVLKIIQTMKDYHSRNQRLFIIARVAEWSLDSFCRQHPRVLALCKKKLPELQGVVRERVEEVVNTIDSESLVARLPESKMIKAVIRETTPGIALDPIRLKPKTFYRVGSKAWRIQKSSSARVDLITLVKEPDIWIIQMPDKDGIHFVGPYPINYFFPSIQSSDGQIRLRGLQLGTEVLFMQTMKAKQQPIRHENKECVEFSVDTDSVKAELICETNGLIPLRLTVYQEDRMIYQHLYDEYRADLKPDPSLFEVPGDVKISEDNEPFPGPQEEQGDLDKPGLSPFIKDRLPRMLQEK